MKGTRKRIGESMNTYIGIDLGTSSVKILLVSADGKILNSVSKDYPICYPQSGWSEQNPEDWASQAIEGLCELLDGQDKASVKGISFGGQMHGLVILDKDDKVIRPAILWNDGRTQAQSDRLNDEVGKQTLSKYTANISFAGFTAPKILWVEENEPENFAKIEKLMLPKDYLAYVLSGVHATDYSDASGMLLLDVKNKCWSDEMASICHIKKEWLPTLYESYAPIGKIKPKIAHRVGLSEDVLVCAGAGDNAAAAIGTGTTEDGSCNISLGTSGTVFIAKDGFSVDENNSLHSFCHATGKYHLMGCILSAASCNKWWMENILESDDYAGEQKGLYDLIRENEVYFLPYLMGERSPHNDANARGAFVGMRPYTTRKHMLLAIMEGVAFALRDCIEVAKASGVKIERSLICGGGAKNEIWRTIVANVLGIEVQRPQTEEGPAYGGAILAMVGCGEYASINDATGALIKIKDSISPSKELIDYYDNKYRVFKQIYPALKSVYAQI